MKKVLLATTALVLSAGFAAAEAHSGISLSGSANAGLQYDSDRADQIIIKNEVNMVITGVGMSDNGLEFGAFIDIDESGVDDAEVYISGIFGTLTTGDVDPATDGFGVADVGFDGLGVDDVAEQYKTAASSADLVYSYSASGLTFIASAGVDTDDYAAAIEYATDMFSAGIGYADGAGGTNTVTVVAGISQGPISANALYSDWSGGGQGYGIDVSFDAGPATLTAVYTNASGVAADPADGLGSAYGLGVSVPLGGGLAVAAGVAIIETDAVADGSKTVADLGVTMSF